MQHIKRDSFEIVLRQFGIIEALAAYDPHIAGLLVSTLIEVI